MVESGSAECSEGEENRLQEVAEESKAGRQEDVFGKEERGEDKGVRGKGSSMAAVEPGFNNK